MRTGHVIAIDGKGTASVVAFGNYGEVRAKFLANELKLPKGTVFAELYKSDGAKRKEVAPDKSVSVPTEKGT